MNQTSLAEFKENINRLVKEIEIDLSTIFEISDTDQDGLLNEIEFIYFFKQFNPNFDDDYLLQLHFQFIKNYQQVNISTLKQFLGDGKLESPEIEFYQEFLHVKNGNPLSDKGFPPDVESLGKFEKEYKWKQIQIDPIFQQGSKALPKQGKLGNCYLIAPLASFYYTHPDQIKSLILDSGNNLVCVRLCIDGQWKAVWVDNFFPVTKKTQKIAFAKSLDGTTWPLILEKAFAKTYGSYRLISGGFSRTTLRSLCGAPSQKIRTVDPNFIEQMHIWGQEKFPMTANSRKRDRLDQLDQEEGKDGSQGLSANHNYSILKVTKGLIKVRNPWGFRKWKYHKPLFI